MKCVVLSTSPALRDRYVLAVENLGETWRCVATGDQNEAYHEAHDADIMMLLPGRVSEELLSRLAQRPMTATPYLLGCNMTHPMLDGQLCFHHLSSLPGWLADHERQGLLPRLVAVQLPEMTCLARGLLRALSVPPGLKAWSFLPDMTAMAALHPALLRDLRSRLYPLSARRHGMTSAAVERSLRLCVESAWSRGKLDALERFFGQSVDPERGKPTNREFLRRVSEELTIAARRLESG